MKMRGWVAGVLIVCSAVTGCAKGEAAPEAVFAGPMGGEAAPAPPPPEAPKSDLVREEGVKDGSFGGYGDENAKQKPTDARTAPSKQAPDSGPKNPGTEDPARKQPILIYRAEFSMAVFEVEKSLDAVESLAKEHGGYLSRREDRLITVRVPAQKFQDLVAAIEKVGDVTHRNVVSEDVTAEYRDLEVQLQNQLALRSRFEKLLEKAQKVEEALAIERELGRITGEIERIKGRLKLLTDLAQYSTITVNFEPRSNQQIQQGPFVLPLPWLREVGLRRLLKL